MIERWDGKFPLVLLEKEGKSEFSVLQLGYLVKIAFNNANLPYSELIGIFKGVNDSAEVTHIVLEIAGDRLKANTAGRLCESKLEKCYPDEINSIQILARERLVVFEIFHALGVQKVYRKNAEDRIGKAQACLNDQSGLNLISW